VFVKRRRNGWAVLTETPLIANGTEISRIGGGVKIINTERKVQVPR
jgi:hypothetical protein